MNRICSFIVLIFVNSKLLLLLLFIFLKKYINIKLFLFRVNYNIISGNGREVPALPAPVPAPEALRTYVVCHMFNVLSYSYSCIYI